jgi:H+-transporting ATPase
LLIALPNDLLILAIVYHKTKVSPRPVRWNMPEMLTVVSVLGVAGVIASFLLFFLLRKAGFPEPAIQSMLFLKLIVAGHSTLYITRFEGWFWERP